VTPADILPYVTGAGGALFVLVAGIMLFLTGKLHSDREFARLVAENDALKTEARELRTALRTERAAVNETASTAQVTTQLISALTDLATEQRHRHRPAGLTGEDLGL
jgi:hypothetical protein